LERGKPEEKGRRGTSTQSTSKEKKPRLHFPLEKKKVKKKREGGEKVISDLTTGKKKEDWGNASLLH